MPWWKIAIFEIYIYLNKKNRKWEKEGKSFKTGLKEEFTIPKEDWDNMKDKATEPYKEMWQSIKSFFKKL